MHLAHLPRLVGSGRIVVEGHKGTIGVGVIGDEHRAVSRGFLSHNEVRALRLHATCDDVNSLLRVGHAEVVEHNTVHATVVEHLLQLVEGTNLNLNFQVKPLFLQVLMAAVDGVGDTTGEIHVVVLQQDHVEESNTMVATATDLHGLLLEHTHARRRLAGIEHTGLRTLQSLHVLIGHGGDTAHALHDIQHQALRL